MGSRRRLMHLGVKTGDPDGGGVGPAPAVQIVTGALGDSITAHGSQAVTTTFKNIGLGFQTNLDMISRSTFILPPENNKAVSGDTASQQSIASATNIAAMKAGTTHIWLMVGVNSITGGTTAASVESSISNIITNIRNAGMITLLQTITPADDVVANPSFETARLAVNTWIRSQAAADVIIFDLEDTFNLGGADPMGNRASDGKHPNDLGGYIGGQFLYDRLSTIYGTLPFDTDFSTDNLIPNGALTGSGGSAENGTSLCPDSWRTRSINGTSTTGRTFSRDGNGVLQVTDIMSTTGTAQAWRLECDFTSVSIAAGDKIYLEFDIEVMPGATGLDVLFTNLNFTGTGVGNPNISQVNPWIPPEMYGITQGRHKVRSPVVTVSGTSLSYFAYIQGGKASATTDVNHVVKFYGAVVKKVA